MTFRARFRALYDAIKRSYRSEHQHYYQTEQEMMNQIAVTVLNDILLELTKKQNSLNSFTDCEKSRKPRKGGYGQ